MAWLKARFGDISKIDGLDTPMVSGPSVITCDDADYARTFKNEDRKGLLFSAPFYGPDGKFKGVIAAIIRNNAIRKLLPARESRWSIPSTTSSSPSERGVTWKLTADQARRGVADKVAIYSELMPLKINDPQSNWLISANAADATFYEGAEYQRSKPTDAPASWPFSCSPRWHAPAFRSPKGMPQPVARSRRGSARKTSVVAGPQRNRRAWSGLLRARCRVLPEAILRFAWVMKWKAPTKVFAKISTPR